MLDDQEAKSSGLTGVTSAPLKLLLSKTFQVAQIGSLSYLARLAFFLRDMFLLEYTVCETELLCM